VDEKAEPAEIHTVDPKLARSQLARLKRLRSGRDASAVSHALDALEAAARATDNLMPPILTAVEAYATTGEICNRLRDVFGTYQPPTAV
jgi:methylmalonyl-CoA mutase N-terminal domain/subunit